MRYRRLLRDIVAAGLLGQQRHWPLHYSRRFFASEHTLSLMSSNGDEGGFTTNAKDQAEVAKLKQRLQAHNDTGNSTTTGASTGTTSAPATRVPSVILAEGTHKYVLIRAIAPRSVADEQYFVTSKQGAAYHRDVAEPLIKELEYAGYGRIDVTGGGRISLDSTARTMKIYGFSYGFGLADHSISRRVVLEDSRYADFDVTTSDEGY